MKEIEEKKLKPCPFCGAEAFFWIIMENIWKVSCSKDCVTMPPRFDMGFSSEDEAMKHWNNQILLSSLQGTQIYIEQLRGALGYSIPDHIRENPEIKNGIAEALYQQLETTQSELKLADQLRTIRDEEFEELKVENDRLNRVYNLELDRANKVENQHFQTLLKLENEKERADKTEERVKGLNEIITIQNDLIIKLVKKLDEIKTDPSNRTFTQYIYFRST
jgi:hypothetical protein